jgi:hypothetical protein
MKRVAFRAIRLSLFRHFTTAGGSSSVGRSVFSVDQAAIRTQ